MEYVPRSHSSVMPSGSAARVRLYIEFPGGHVFEHELQDPIVSQFKTERTTKVITCEEAGCRGCSFVHNAYANNNVYVTLEVMGELYDVDKLFKKVGDE